MIKTIKIGQDEKDVITLSNNIEWAIIYRDQFGTDIIATLTPALAAGIDVLGGILETVGAGKKEIELADLAAVIDGDTLIDAVAHLSGLEFVDMINITWAMAKASKDDIPEPRRWVRQFEEFPIDVIIPEVVKLAVKGMVSIKNVKRLKGLINQMKDIKISQPLTQTPSSLRVLNEG